LKLIAIEYSYFIASILSNPYNTPSHPPGHTDAPTRMVGTNLGNIILDQYGAEMPLKGYGTNQPIKFFHVQYWLDQGGSLIDTAISYKNGPQIATG
jgi:hypothetical protein